MAVACNLYGPFIWNFLALLGAKELRRQNVGVTIANDGSRARIQAALGTITLEAPGGTFAKCVKYTDHLESAAGSIRGAAHVFSELHGKKRPCGLDLDKLAHAHEDMSVFTPIALENLDDRAELVPVPERVLMIVREEWPKRGTPFIAGRSFYVPQEDEIWVDFEEFGDE